jgi:hypothetical protein
MAKKTTSLEVAQTADPIALIPPKVLREQMKMETEKRKILTQYIATNLKKGTDYGAIHVMSRDKCPKPWECKNKYHYSKDVLFKPGAEKFCSLFKLRAEFSKDTETWEMLGSRPETVAYLCRLYTANGVLVGEGRGVCSVKEKASANTAVKIAEKRAKLDAILATGALSDFFTQDLEDEEYSGKKDTGDPLASDPLDPEDAYEIARKAIWGATNDSWLTRQVENIENSKLYTPAQKKELTGLISIKIDELNNV